MMTDQRYRDGAREARGMTAFVVDHDTHRSWREIAEAFEQVTELPGKMAFWPVEPVEETN
jgi:hypothetical protein